MQPLPIAITAMLMAAVTPAEALITINEPWVRIGSDAQTVEAFMQVTDTDGGVLVSIRTPMAVSVEMHARGKVAPLVRLPLPAGRTIVLAPGGARLLLRGYSGPRKPGGRVPFTLRVESSEGVAQIFDINAEVRRRSPSDDERRGHRH